MHERVDVCEHRGSFLRSRVLCLCVMLCRPKPDSKPDSKKRMVERAVAGHKGQNLRGKCAERVETGRGVQREVF